MPSYGWVCFACQGSNRAGKEVCQHCGFAARATSRDIEVAQRGLANIVPSAALPTSGGNDAPSEAEGPSAPAPLVALLLVAFGVLCLVGAYQSLAHGRWPAFMPPQLDLIAVPLSWLSETLGAWVGSAIAGLIGLVCIFGGLVSAKDRGAA